MIGQRFEMSLKQMTKKALSLILVVLMLFCVSIGCAEEKSDTDAIIQKLVTDLQKFLGANEVIYGSRYKALGFGADYCRDRKWDDLVRARASAFYVESQLEYLTTFKLEPSMTVDDYDALEVIGMDVGDLWTEINLFNEDTLANISDSDLPAWRNNYAMNLVQMFYDSNDVVVLNNWIQYQIKYASANAKFVYLVNNYVFLELPEAAGVEHLQWCDENLPFIMALYDEPFTTKNDVLNEMKRVLDEYEEILLSVQEVDTQMQILRNKERAFLSELSDYADPSSQDNELNTDEVVQRLLDEATANYGQIKSIVGVPQVVSYPPLADLENAVFRYYWKNEAGELNIVDSSFALETIPNCLNIEIPNSTEAAFYDYALYLRDMGFKIVDMIDTAILFQLDDNAFLMVSIEDTTLNINLSGAQLCFAVVPYFVSLSWAQ